MIADIDIESSEGLVEKLGKNASAVKADVSKTLDVENMIKKTV